MKRLPWFFGFWMQLVRCGLGGEDPTPLPVNTVVLGPAFINSLSGTMRTNAPALRAVAARSEAAAAGIAAVRTWEDPMLMVGGQFADAAMRADEGDLLYGAQQKLPLFGKPTRARRLAREELAVEQTNQEAAFQAYRRDLARALFRAAYAQRVAEVGVQDLEWLDAMVRTTEERYRVGDAPQTYLLRLQNERARRVDQLTTDRQRGLQELAVVDRLLGRDVATVWPRLELPPLAGEVRYTERLVGFALEQEPRLRVMRRQVRLAEAAVEVSRRMRYPDVAVGAEARNYSGTGEFRQAMLTVSITLPWLNDGKYRQDVRRETARRQAAELDAADYELQVRQEIRRLTFEIDAARREALLYGNEIAPRSEQALASAQASWMANRAQFLDVMEARRMLIEAKLMQARAVSEQYQALAELLLCCGLGDLDALEVADAGAGAASPR